MLRLFLIAVLGLINVAPVWGQVGNTSKVRLPGWLPSDGVAPDVLVDVDYDQDRQEWRYEYKVSNRFQARQGIHEIWLRFEGGLDEVGIHVEPPKGWMYAMSLGARTAIPGIVFFAKVADPKGGKEQQIVPRPMQIDPGESLSGFVITAPYPPGIARAYVRGFVPAPELSIETHGHLYRDIPHDTTNAQRAWVVGPTVYGQVIDQGGGDDAGTDQLAGWLNPREGSVHPVPVPVAVRFSPAADPSSFRASLNGHDVTEAFYAISAEGLDWIAVFDQSGSPLADGSNTIEISVASAADPARVDRDVLGFKVLTGATLVQERP